MRRKTRVLTPVFRQLSFSQLISTVCRILPHCAHAADMNFYLSIFGILIRTGIQRYQFWSISQFLLSSGFLRLFRTVYLLLLLLKMKFSVFVNYIKKEPDKIQMSFHIYTSSGPGRYDRSYADSLSTNLFLVEADRNDRSADGAFNFDNALYCFRIRVKQPFIFTTWTSHMHFLHIFSPPARGQPKGNVKLTVGDCFIFLCTVCRDLNPMVAINIVYRTCVLLSTNFLSYYISY